MRVAFICSGRPDNLKYLKNNRTLLDITLRKYGWEVMSTPLLSISDLNTRLQEYNLNSIDEFLFFYTGHGDVSGRQQILKLQLDKSEISINDVLDSIFKYINPKKQVIGIDACYSGTLDGIKLETNVEFLFSSQAMEQSYEDDELKYSLFSYYFSEGIDKLDGKVTCDQLSKYISLKNNKQTPLSIKMNYNDVPLNESRGTLIEYSKTTITNTKVSFINSIGLLIVFDLLYIVLVFKNWEDMQQLLLLIPNFLLLGLLLGISTSLVPYKKAKLSAFSLGFLTPSSTFLVYLIINIFFTPLHAGYSGGISLNEQFMLFNNIVFFIFISILFGFLSSLGNSIGLEIKKMILKITFFKYRGNNSYINPHHLNILSSEKKLQNIAYILLILNLLLAIINVLL